MIAFSGNSIAGEMAMAGQRKGRSMVWPLVGSFGALVLIAGAIGALVRGTVRVLSLEVVRTEQPALFYVLTLGLAALAVLAAFGAYNLWQDWRQANGRVGA